MMGCYLNPISEGLQRSLRSQIYVDKSLLIRETNRLVRTNRRHVCLSRPHQFGKTMAVDLLAAYYGCAADTRPMFDGLKISQDSSFEDHLNHYDVIRVNMRMLSGYNPESNLNQLNAHIVNELIQANRSICFRNKKSLPQVMMDIFAATGRAFVILIDEWDCPLRENSFDQRFWKLYLDYLRAWLKDQDYVALAYMTGLMPVARYEAYSALNMFSDYTMINPGSLAPFFGFTEDEAAALCQIHGMPFDELREWYGGYDLIECRADGDVHHRMLHPRSAAEALLRRKPAAYWVQGVECAAMKNYLATPNAYSSPSRWIQNALQAGNAIERLLKGEHVEIDPAISCHYQIDQESRDEWLTLLVCLGYLALDADSRSAFIPNREAMRMIAEINNICREENPLILPIDPRFPPDGIDPFL